VVQRLTGILPSARVLYSRSSNKFLLVINLQLLFVCLLHVVFLLNL
jgi:hypothetical protein